MADVHTAVYFGNEVGATANKKPEDIYHDIVWAIKGDEAEWRRKTNRAWFREAQQISEDKSFFHWELEFPEMFFEDGFGKENPGWDCVIGNPPYGATFELIERDYIINNFESVAWRGESYIAFVELALKICCKNGNASMIVPDTWMSLKFTECIRTSLFISGSLKHIVALPTGVFNDASVDTSIFVLQKKENIQKDAFFSETRVIAYPKGASIKSIDTQKGNTYNQLDWAKNPYSIINPYATPYQFGILNKINTLSLPLLELTEVKYGLKAYQVGKGKPPQTREQVGKKEFTDIVQKSSNFKPFLEGREIYRYLNTWDANNWINWGSWLAEPRSKGLFIGERLLFRKIAGKRLTGTYIDEDAFSNTLLYIIKSKDKNYLLKSVLSILNSALIGFFFRLAYSIHDDDLFPQIMLDDISNLPIRRINFTTQLEERTALVESLKSRYNATEFDKIIQLVEECLPKDTEGNFITDEEKSDVVHDLLAFLAERMIEMNKGNNEEIQGFLEWFEREIDAKIETLTNKTKLKQYHDLGFDELLDILKKNKKKIPVNLSNRELQGNLKEGFEGSTRKLRPLIDRIEKTDWLIDRVVYRLYGLSEEEVRMVEGELMS
jgi:hypothetical protein